ncbi:MAG: GIY-YIG nuclease family protein [Lachnospiraceae bacterium]|nr:GIY-YIG nuclease family protein [Lachnospiraceae bacterium]
MQTEKPTAYTYIVQCRDGTLYTGWTNRLEERLRCHNAGRGAKYTRSRLPVRLVYYECHAARQAAMRREYAIKQLSRQEKLRLIAECGEEIRAACRRINDRVYVMNGDNDDKREKEN